MDVRKLLLLGLLMGASQHAYRLNESIEDRLGSITGMSKSTAYAILERLVESGEASMQHEPQRTRPPRKVYSITPQGQQEFFALLRDNLATSAPLGLTSEAGLLFLDALDQREAASLLRQRLTALQGHIDEAQRMATQATDLGAQLANEHRLALLRADQTWLADVVRRLEEGE